MGDVPLDPGDDVTIRYRAVHGDKTEQKFTATVDRLGGSWNQWLFLTDVEGYNTPDRRVVVPTPDDGKSSSVESKAGDNRWQNIAQPNSVEILGPDGDTVYRYVD